MMSILLEFLLSFCILFKPDVILVIIIGGYVVGTRTQQERIFDLFIQFLNINEDFLKTASEMDLVLFIKDKYEHFLLLR